MTYSDKSGSHGYDEITEELARELDDLAERFPPHLMRKVQNRIHNGIITRMKENAHRNCMGAVQDLEKCAEEKLFHEAAECMPQRDVLNACFRRENSEENYQKLRLKFLRGELYELYKDRLVARVETFKETLPNSFLPEGKVAMYGDQTFDHQSKWTTQISNAIGKSDSSDHTMEQELT